MANEKYRAKPYGGDNGVTKVEGEGPYSIHVNITSVDGTRVRSTSVQVPEAFDGEKVSVTIWGHAPDGA